MAEWFVKSIERIQAATKGAKVRRRLKMRQTQTITMEIKVHQILSSSKCSALSWILVQ
jgi:hypothetical protein